MLSFIKNKINQLLDWISKGNQEAFGNKRLDCCDLNRDSKE